MSHSSMGKCFAAWARILIRWDKCVLIVFFIIYSAISLNLLNFASYDDQKAIWTPADNRTLRNQQRMKRAFPLTSIQADSEGEVLVTDTEDIFVMIEAKQPEDDSLQTLFTVDHFKEMIDFENFVLNMTVPAELAAQVGEESLSFTDLCKKNNEDREDCEQDDNSCEPRIYDLCEVSQRPIDFIYKPDSDTFDLSRYTDDMKLISKIQKGKDSQGQNIYVELMFGGTIPKELQQDYSTGRNDLYAAKAARWKYVIDSQLLSEGYSASWILKFLLYAEEEMHQWGKSSKYFNVHVMTKDTWQRHFVADVTSDVGLLGIAVVLVSTYSFFVLGSLSPIHFRSVTSLLGIFCVLLGTGAGYATAFFIGQEASNFHNILPFMILGIGVDDMFVIVNSVDQQPWYLPSDVRFLRGFTHAGPSITLTSVTGALAFFFGAISSLPALRSFCMFAGICVCSLYFCFITIFSAWFVIDLRRMHNMKGDCCGLCCCKRDTILCCRGHFLTKQQRQFLRKNEMDAIDTEETENPGYDVAEYSSTVERIIATVFAPNILTRQGRITVLISWFCLAIWAVYGITQMKSTFSMEFFIPKGSLTDMYFQTDIKYFQTGIRVTTIVENSQIDYSSEEVQYQLFDFYDKLQRSYLCDQTWFEEWTLDSPFMKYLYWVKYGQCSLLPQGLAGFQRVVPSELFYPCLNELLQLASEDQKADLAWINIESGQFSPEMTVEQSSLDEQDPLYLQRKLLGFKSYIQVKRIADSSVEGVQFLLDLRDLEDKYGVEGTYSFSWQFLDFEQWFTFRGDTTLCFLLSGAAVLGIVLIVSADLIVTAVVTTCVVYTNVCLFGLIHFWSLTVNPLVVLNIIVAIGISVDYSAHIAYSFLTEPPPEKSGYDTPEKIRLYKATVAVSKMGSSVFHGGFSTFLAILVLAPGKTYVFVVFFRIWIGIIIFGMANGFLLLPVLLSFIGPTKTTVDPTSFGGELDHNPKIEPTNEGQLETEPIESAKVNTRKPNLDVLINPEFPTIEDENKDKETIK